MAFRFISKNTSVSFENFSEKGLAYYKIQQQIARCTFNCGVLTENVLWMPQISLAKEAR